MPDIIAELTWRGLINQTTDDANLPRLAGGEAADASTSASIPRPTACTSATWWP